MEKYLNHVSIVAGVVGGILANLLGGMDTILHALLFVVVVDYITGLIKAYFLQDLSSKIGFKGLVKKVLIFVVIAVAVEVEKVLGGAIPLREIVIMFYLSNEGISFLENTAEFLPLPDKLKDAFQQIRSNQDWTTDIDPDDQENNIQ